MLTTPGMPTGRPAGSESAPATTYPPSTTTRITPTTAIVAQPPRDGDGRSAVHGSRTARGDRGRAHVTPPTGGPRAGPDAADA